MEYNLTDHLGSTRMMYKLNFTCAGVYQNATIQYLADYYSFGKIVREYINPGTLAEKYQYTGKERDTESGYDYFNARNYHSEVGRFLSVDPLADKYPGWSSYNYTMNNPIRFIDPDGRAPETVKPGSQAALNMIKNTLTKADAQFVRLDQSGNIDKDFLNSNSNSTSGNFASLQTLVNSEIMVTVDLANSYSYSDSEGNLQTSDMPYLPADEYSDFDLDGSTMSGTSTGESGFLGKTLFPDNTGLQNSPTNELKIIVNSSLSPAGQAEMYSHEANGHGKIYIQTNGDRNAASHQPKGMRETNKNLVNEIVKSKQETIINMKQQ
jgi:RHS repeat-associated protein